MVQYLIVLYLDPHCIGCTFGNLWTFIIKFLPGNVTMQKKTILSSSISIFSHFKGGAVIFKKGISRHKFNYSLHTLSQMHTLSIHTHTNSLSIFKHTLFSFKALV